MAGPRALAAVFLLSSTTLAAQIAPEAGGALADRARVDPRLWIVPSAVPLAEAPGAHGPGGPPAWVEFRASAGGRWEAFADPRSGLIRYAEGSGVPWIPGRGNPLTWADAAPAGKPRDTLALLEVKSRELLARLGPALGVHAGELALNRARSGAAADHLWVVDFDVVRGGLPVEGARVVLRVNNGNLIQLGAEAVPAPGTPTPDFDLTREQALAALASYAGGLGYDDELLDRGSRHLLPSQAQGKDVGLAAVWEFVFRRGDDPATWRARVDAGSGEVVELVDLNRYAGATGGVYSDTFAAGGESVLPMPWVDLSTGGFANGAGVYSWSGGALSSQLRGRYVEIQDGCGSISLAAGAKGNLAFGTSAGTDCATPGSGGAGNTPAARTTYYHVNRAKEAARGWLGGSWLHSQLPVNTNIPATCNAFWNGFSLNFYRSGGGCGNTGEIADVALHELGHGLDSNDGLPPVTGELGTGETYGDVMAAMTFHDSCIGDGFRPGPCGGYGDPCTECTGVRDIDWAKHASGTPHTVANFVQPKCPFPGGLGFYVGPCGAHALAANQPEKAREGHCESYVSSEALWDLAARDLPEPGTANAWAMFERLWYRSRSTAGRAFACDTSTPVWTSHGCTVDSYWRALRAADDDDGNLANGTPNSCHLFAAFDRHGIACPSDPAAGVCHRACTPPAVPSLTLTPDNEVVDVAWTSSGAPSEPGTVYDLYRSEAGCESGFVKIAAGVTATTYRDTEVANGFTYSYRVIAWPEGNEACSSAPSSCVQAEPFPCITPGTPAALAAATPQDNQVALSWSNGSPAAAKFNVYRARGSCSGSAFSPLATGVAASPYLDDGVSGTVTYAYRVTATDPTGICESEPECVEVTPAGPCNAPPEFAGLAEVSNPGALQCTLQLAWPAATPLCGGPVTYDVHRGTSPGFTPAPENRVAQGLGGTTWADAGALGDGQTYHYVVRARDLGNGVQDANLVRAGTAPTGPTLLTDLVETFESPGGFDLPGWEHAKTVSYPFSPGPDWTWVPGPGGTSAWFADEHDTAPSGKVLVTPAFGIGPQTTLSFWHRYALQAETMYCRDGGTLELSTDGGATWSVIPKSAFLSGKFNKLVINGIRNPIEDKPAWCGAAMGAMSQVRVDLGAFAGATQARLRWYEGDDDGIAVPEANGWYVDTVTIADTQRIPACTPAPTGLDFHPLTPCRLLDTRNAAGALGGPAFLPFQEREITVADVCGVPRDARALAVNVAVTGAQGSGSLQLFPAHLRYPPSTSFLGFSPGQTRANNGILMLSSDGNGRFTALNSSPGSLHLIVDVTGYYQ